MALALKTPGLVLMFLVLGVALNRQSVAAVNMGMERQVASLGSVVKSDLSVND